MARGLLHACVDIIILIAFIGCVHSRDIKFQIAEELPPDTFVGNVVEDAVLTSLYDSTILPVLRYSFLATPNGGEQNYFKINEITGVVRTSTKLDRDVICRTKRKCVLNVNVAVSPGEYFQVIIVEIELLDVNDNTPTFPSPSMTCVIPESSLPGSTFTLLSASDVDSVENGIQGYELLTELRGIFELKVLNNLDGSTDVRLVLNEQLDRERKEVYSVTVVARDGGKPSLTGTLLVNISVGDSNDNHPEFTNASYHVYVYENSSRDSVILNVEALDADVGDNGRIVYGFTERTVENYPNVFGLNSATGDLSVKATRLDYEVDSLYQLVVYARDMGVDSQPAYCVVVVHVMDINDNAPSLTISTLTRNGVAKVSEHAKGNTFIAHVSAIDSDSGENGEISCHIDSDTFKLERLQKTQFKIVTLPQSRIDREENDRLVITLTCTDKGHPPLSTSQNLTIAVTDWNDETPVFSQIQYRANVEENNKIGDVLIRVHATDDDLGNNGKVEYKLGSEHDRFYIDSSTGAIYTAVSLDYETVHEISFSVIAYDLGNTSLSSTADVLVTIIDANDEPPVFPKTFFSFGTFENQPVGTEIGNILATDRDSSDNAIVTYKLISTDAESLECFVIDSNTGQIRNRKILDREHRSVYHLTAIASDKERPSLRTNASIAIYVVDENDNSPAFIFPNLTAGNDTVRVSNQIPRGHVIARIRASDADSGHNAQLRYMLLNYRNTFRIDIITGVLSVINTFKSTNRKTYNVTILVRDRGTTSRNSTAALLVIIDRSVAYLPSGDEKSGPESRKLLSSNVTTVAAIAAASLIIIIILVVAIILIKCSDRRQCRETTSVYQTEAQIMLNTGSSETRSPSSPPGDKDSMGSANSCDKMVDETTMDRQKKSVRPSADGCSDDAKYGSRLSWSTPVWKQQNAEQVRKLRFSCICCHVSKLHQVRFSVLEMPTVTTVLGID